MNREFKFLMYRAADEDVSVNTVIKDETVWLTQKAMAELFDVKVPAISKHLKNVFEEGEPDEKAVVSKMEITTQHGALKGKTQTKDTRFYNLDAIISVGYRVNSKRATHFRRRPKKGEWGLNSWKNAPEGRIQTSDVSVAKNYLDEKQIRRLERAVSGYFDYIEELIERENAFTMEEFAASIDEFLAFRRYDVLPDKGRISGQKAKAKAEAEYAAFNRTQKITSDFDREVKRILEKGGNSE